MCIVPADQLRPPPWPRRPHGKGVYVIELTRTNENPQYSLATVLIFITLCCVLLAFQPRDWPTQLRVWHAAWSIVVSTQLLAIAAAFFSPRQQTRRERNEVKAAQTGFRFALLSAVCPVMLYFLLLARPSLLSRYYEAFHSPFGVDLFGMLAFSTASSLLSLLCFRNSRLPLWSGAYVLAFSCLSSSLLSFGPVVVSWLISS